MKRTLSAAVLAGALSTGAVLIPVSSVVAQETPAPTEEGAPGEGEGTDTGNEEGAPGEGGEEESGKGSPVDPENFPEIAPGALVAGEEVSMAQGFLPVTSQYLPINESVYSSDDDTKRTHGVGHNVVVYLGESLEKKEGLQFDTELFDAKTGESTGIKISSKYENEKSSDPNVLFYAGSGGNDTSSAYAFNHKIQSADLVKLRGKSVTPVTQVTQLSNGKKVTIGTSDPAKVQAKDVVHLFDLEAKPSVTEFDAKDGIKGDIDLTLKNIHSSAKDVTIDHAFYLVKDGKRIEGAVIHGGKFEGDIDVKPDSAGAEGATTAQVKGEFEISGELLESIKKENGWDSLEGYELEYAPQVSFNTTEETNVFLKDEKAQRENNNVSYLTNVAKIKMVDAEFPKWEDAGAEAGSEVAIPNAGGEVPEGLKLSVDGPGFASVNDKGELVVKVDPGASVDDVITVTVKNAAGTTVDEVKVTVGGEGKSKLPPSWDDASVLRGKEVTIPNDGGPVPEGADISVEGRGKAAIDEEGNLIVTVDEEARSGEKFIVTVKDADGKVIDTVTFTVEAPDDSNDEEDGNGDGNDNENPGDGNEGEDSDDPENPGTGGEDGEGAGDDKEQAPEELDPEDEGPNAGSGKGGNSPDGANKGTEDSGVAEDLAPEDGGTEGEGEDGKFNDASEVKTGGEVTSKTGVLAAGIASLMAFAAGAVGLITRRKKQ